MGFPRQEYQSELPFSSPGNHPEPVIKLVSPASPALAGGFITTVLPGKPIAFYKEPDNECWWAIRIWHNDRKKVTAGKGAWRKTNGTEPFFFKHNFILILNEKK